LSPRADGPNGARIEVKLTDNRIQFTPDRPSPGSERVAPYAAALIERRARNLVALRAQITEIHRLTPQNEERHEHPSAQAAQKFPHALAHTRAGIVDFDGQRAPSQDHL